MPHVYPVRRLTRTIYVPEPDIPLWEWLAAQAEAEHRSLSSMVSRAIEALKAARQDA